MPACKGTAIERTDTAMSDNPDGRRWVAGLNQSVKLIRAGKAKKIYLAIDADRAFKERVQEEVRESGGVAVDMRYSAAEIASFAGIDVDTAILTEY